MEDFDILNKFDNDKLIDIVKNYKRYGYNDALRNYVINLLEERGWSREDLQRFGYLTNNNYDEAENIIRKTKCFDFLKRSVYFPKRNVLFFTSPTLFSTTNYR